MSKKNQKVVALKICTLSLDNLLVYINKVYFRLSEVIVRREQHIQLRNTSDPKHILHWPRTKYKSVTYYMHNIISRTSVAGRKYTNMHDRCRLLY
jgi:hypothetical protein